MSDRPLNVALFIGTLQTGGAERQIAQLARGLANVGVGVSLLTVHPGGQFWDEVEQSPGVRLLSLYRERSSTRTGRLCQIIGAPSRLRKALGLLKPDFLYSMLHLSNLVALLASGRAEYPRLVWGIRASAGQSGWRTSIPKTLCRWLSYRVSYFISNSHSGLEQARADGFQIRSGVVVPNGVDSALFDFDASGRERIRRDIGLDDLKILVGIVGRLHPMKGHDVFLSMAAGLRAASNEYHFISVGGRPGSHEALRVQADAAGLAGSMTIMQSCSDLPAIYSAIDVVVSASLWGEGFPNVIAEAMSCSRAVVATDVGDSAVLVKSLGAIVPAGDAEALANAVRTARDNSNGDCLRQRIVENYSIEASVGETLRQLESWR